MMLLLLGSLSFGLAVFMAAEVVTYPARRRRALLWRATSYGEGKREGLIQKQARPAGGPGPVLRLFATLVTPFVPAKARANMSRRLLSAGLAQKVTPEQLLGWKSLLAFLGVALGALVGLALAPALGILCALALCLLGFLAPDVFVNGRIATRREIIQAALPDSLDLLAVSVEAGLGIDGAIAKLTEYMDGPLVEEFALTLNEMRMGESRIEALKRMAARTDVPELSSFVRALVQADQLGASIGSILRVQAADARTRRQIAAEEKAMKAPIKMLFPMAIFILPAMFIVVLGPALIRFGTGFG